MSDEQLASASDERVRRQYPAAITTGILLALAALGCAVFSPAQDALVGEQDASAIAESWTDQSPPADAVPYPEGVVGERGRELVEILNTGDETSITAFVEERFRAGFPPGGSVEDFRRWMLDTKTQYPALVLRHVTNVLETGATLYVESTDNHAWLRIRYMLHAEAPHGLADLWFDPASEPDPVLLALGDEPLDATARQHIVAKINSLMAAHYLFPEVATAAAQDLDARLKGGEYQSAVSLGALAEQLTRDLQAVTKDEHVIVVAKAAHDGVGGAAPREPPPGADDFGIVGTKVLRGNAGYMELTFFAPEHVSGDAIAEAMKILEDTDAIIIDLRRNGGGARTGVENLSSYFLPAKTHIGTFVSHRGKQVFKSFTLDEIKGTRRLDVPVFVLTSQRSFSAAEAFSYDLQAQGRVTIVGEVTGGGAHAGPWIEIMPGLSVLVPEGRAVNPVTSSNWQGTGVQPDVKVEAALALERALELAKPAASSSRRSKARGPNSPQHPDRLAR